MFIMRQEAVAMGGVSVLALARDYPMTDDEQALIEAMGEAQDMKSMMLLLTAYKNGPAGVVSWLAAQRETCPTCGGQGCEYGCGHCEMSPGNAGPDAHKVCRTCHGEGTVRVDVVAELVKLGVLGRMEPVGSPLEARDGGLVYSYVEKNAPEAFRRLSQVPQEHR